MRILIVASYSPSLINFREQLLRSLVSKNHQVWAAAPFSSKHLWVKSKLSELGVVPLSWNLARQTLNPLLDIQSFAQLVFFYLRFRPELVLAYTVKPVIYSGLLCRACILLGPRSRFRFLALITGLGYAFTDGQRTAKRRFLRQVLSKLFKIALSASDVVAFQNPDDQAEFEHMSLVPNSAKLIRVWGSGVDLTLFPHRQLPKSPVFLMLSRLLADKGIREYVNAARIVKQQFPFSVFRLAGMLDPNPTAISREELEEWITEGVIEYLGDLHSVHTALTACRFYVLPSYREGTPRSVLEAMATGRPILTTDAPGCRQTVIDGVNGFLVPPRNSEALANAMLRLIEQPESETHRMAQASLNLARERFDVHKVNAQLLEAMGA